MRNVASPLNYFTRLSLFCNLQHTAGVEQLLGQRVTTGRENMTSDGRKTSVYRRWVDRECGAAGAAGGGRGSRGGRGRQSSVSRSYARLSEERAWPIGPRRVRSLILCGTEALNLGLLSHTNCCCSCSCSSSSGIRVLG